MCVELYNLQIIELHNSTKSHSSIPNKRDLNKAKNEISIESLKKIIGGVVQNHKIESIGPNELKVKNKSKKPILYNHDL